ncbi:MAG: exodeoxyribonuclease VII small subunit [Candidatus Viridilinea halotolerans]|uniref:Exodeoxyribonuclease 7 small subunit n=1 Tax=Candidatus Viridilinea halotolerans TaxID=2491704 RepID=A0A426TTM1_9CHLR|nr:MAG: exodeoxyribonuclease VII small subunit [Candidatus Viridilinea halotolerans]
MNEPTPVDTYETLYLRLQEVVAQLEAGELSLAETLKLYEQGTLLAAECQRLLDAAELRVQQVQVGEA